MGDYLHSKDTRRVINALFKVLKYLQNTESSTTAEVKESEVIM